MYQEIMKKKALLQSFGVDCFGVRENDHHCPFNSASMLSTKHSATYRIWFHRSDREALVIRPLIHNTDTALADRMCL